MRNDNDLFARQLMVVLPTGLSLLLAAWVTLMAPPSLESPRLREGSFQLPIGYASEQVTARLWQEPFGPVQRHLAEAKQRARQKFAEFGGSSDYQTLLNEEVFRSFEQVFFREFAGSTKAKRKIIFLTVFMPGNVFPEDTESCRRRRYAVLSALSTAGYVPVSGDRIGFFVLDKRSYCPERDFAKNSLLLRTFNIPPVFSPLAFSFPIFSTNPSATEVSGKCLSRLLMPDHYYRDLSLPQTKLTVPCEWFKSIVPDKNSGGVDRYVFVNWLDESAMSPYPFIDLCNVLNDFYDFVKKHEEVEGDFRIIGPTSSTMVKALVDDVEKYEVLCGRCAAFPPNTEIFSTQATAIFVNDSFDKLIEELQSVQDQGCNTTADNPICIPVTNTIGSDLDLARSIQKELELRNIKTGEFVQKGPGKEWQWNDNGHVALVAEWDTHYGRNMFQTYFKAFGMPLKEGESEPKELSPEEQESREKAMLQAYRDLPPEKQRLHCFSYLRGIDGKLPDSEENGNGKSNSAHMTTSTCQILGRSQSDYILRTVQSIKEKGMDPGAIGVVGSDVYDKLLLLRTLRHEFPEAVFFTTDLDVQMLDPQEYDTTHNLVIASHYGLRLKDCFQNQIPPFRDSYQSSLYLGCLVALGYPEAMDLIWPSNKTSAKEFLALKEDASADKIQWQKEVRVFEVGRHGAYELPRLEASVKSPLHPSNPHTTSWLSKKMRWFWYLFALIAVVLFLLPFRGPVQRFAQKIFVHRKHPTIEQYCALIGVLLLIVISFLITTHSSIDGEPFSLYEGISVWPSVFLRLAAFVLAIHFVLRFSLERKLHESKLWELATGTPRLTTISQLGPWIKGSIKAFRHATAMHTRIRNWQKWHRDHGVSSWQRDLTDTESSDNEKSKVYAEVLIDEYQDRGQLTSRLIRSFGHFFTYLLFVFAIFQIYGGTRPPIRGAWCLWINLIVLVLSVIATVWFIFFMLDAVRLCNRFIHLISTNYVIWQKKVMRSEAARFGVPAETQDPLPDWLRHPLYIRMIAGYTTFICGYIAAPFVVLLLMILSRYPAFDNWHWSPHLVVVYVLHALLLAWCAWRANRAAVRIKNLAIGLLREALLDPKYADQIKSIERACAEIESTKQGAFSSPLHSPAIRAILIPFGGVGGLALLEVLMKQM